MESTILYFYGKRKAPVMSFRRNPVFNSLSVLGVSAAFAFACAATPAPAYADLASDLASARTQLEQIGTEYAAINSEITQLGEDLQETSRQIEETVNKLNVTQDELARYTSLGYKGGGISITKIVVNSSDLGSLLSNLFYADKVSDAQADLITEVKTLQSDLEDQQAEQQTAMDAAEQRLAEQAENQARAAALVSSLDAQLRAQLEAEAAQNAAIQDGLPSAADNESASDSSNGNTPSQGDNSSNAGDTSDNTDNGTNNGSDSADNGGGSDSGSNGGSSNNGGTSVTGSSALSIALQYAGYPYVYGGASPSEGFDCSGLTMYAYAQIGISLPHGSNSQLSLLQRTGRFTTNINELQYGDLVFFPGHVAFYTGNGNCFGARRPGVPASETKMAYFGAFLGGGNF